MNRYNGPTSPPSTATLTQVRRGLTESPQTKFSVFNLSPTPYGLEIKLPVSRVRGSLIAAVIKEKSEDSTRLTLWAVVGMALFVGGVVALTGSALFGIMIAILLPFIFWLITLSAKVTIGEDATLRLVNAPNGQTYLSMSVAPASRSSSLSIAERDAARYGLYPADDYAFGKPPATKTALYFSNRSVKLVAAKTRVSGGELSFTVYTDTAREGNCLRVTGSCQEIRWLHARVSQWGKGRS